MKWLEWMPWSYFFWMLNFKPTFSRSFFTFIKRLFSSSSLYAIRVMSSAYLKLLIFLLVILIPACASSSLTFRMVFFVYKLNKEGDSIQSWQPFPILNQLVVPCLVLTCFLTCIQVSQETGKVVWYSHLFKNFPVCCDPHKGSSVVNKAEVDDLEIPLLKKKKKIPLLFLWSNGCWQFDLWFLCLF